LLDGSCWVANVKKGLREIRDKDKENLMNCCLILLLYSVYVVYVELW